MGKIKEMSSSIVKSTIDILQDVKFKETSLCSVHTLNWKLVTIISGGKALLCYTVGYSVSICFNSIYGTTSISVATYRICISNNVATKKVKFLIDLYTMAICSLCIE